MGAPRVVLRAPPTRTVGACRPPPSAKRCSSSPRSPRSGSAFAPAGPSQPQPAIGPLAPPLRARSRKSIRPSRPAEGWRDLEARPARLARLTRPLRPSEPRSGRMPHRPRTRCPLARSTWTSPPPRSSTDCRASVRPSPHGSSRTANATVRSVRSPGSTACAASVRRCQNACARMSRFPSRLVITTRRFLPRGAGVVVLDTIASGRAPSPHSPSPDRRGVDRGLAVYRPDQHSTSIPWLLQRTRAANGSGTSC
jgi:hypothetical protein